jgi:hypothetical protein
MTAESLTYRAIPAPLQMEHAYLKLALTRTPTQ